MILNMLQKRCRIFKTITAQALFLYVMYTFFFSRVQLGCKSGLCTIRPHLMLYCASHYTYKLHLLVTCLMLSTHLIHGLPFAQVPLASIFIVCYTHPQNESLQRNLSYLLMPVYSLGTWTIDYRSPLDPAFRHGDNFLPVVEAYPMFFTSNSMSH